MENRNGEEGPESKHGEHKDNGVWYGFGPAEEIWKGPLGHDSRYT